MCHQRPRLWGSACHHALTSGKSLCKNNDLIVVRNDPSCLARSLLKPVQGRTSQTGEPGSSWEWTLVNRVLVVDDEQTLAQNLQAYLQAQGLEVHLAHDGASGIEQAEALAPDVIVLDYRLPDMEGFQVLETVRRNRQCHFVLITAHPTAEVRERAAELGVSHVLFKPFPLMELARAIFDLMGIKRQRRATDTPAEGFVERRQNRNQAFPLQLYDGSWVLADRRRNGAEPDKPDDEQLLTGE
jgi:CheY-like chemotaxis protein